MARYIYSRVSTDGQTTDGQVLALQARFPDAQVVSEVASGAKQRPILRALLAQLVAGDTLVVAALDRLGRRTSEVLALIEDLERRRIVLVSVREGVDYSTPVGRLVTQILVSVAEMERAMISERTRAGLAAARARGAKPGRPPSIPCDAYERAVQFVRDGMGVQAAAHAAGISRASLSRRLARLRDEAEIAPVQAAADA